MMEKQQLPEKPFLDATKSVFKSMLDMEIDSLPGDENPKQEENVRIEIAMVGDLSGSVVYNFPKSTTLNIVKTLSGMEADRLDDFATSMLGEMANIISGNAATSLSGANCKCDIRPPQITISHMAQSDSHNSVDMLLHSQVGELCEHICLSSNV